MRALICCWPLRASNCHPCQGQGAAEIRVFQNRRDLVAPGTAELGHPGARANGVGFHPSFLYFLAKSSVSVVGEQVFCSWPEAN